jgi:hypothetical protein
MARKNSFEMEVLGPLDCGITQATALIIGTAPKNIPYLKIDMPETGASLYIKDKDLETFAINILASLGYAIQPLK